MWPWCRDHSLVREQHSHKTNNNSMLFKCTNNPNNLQTQPFFALHSFLNTLNNIWKVASIHRGLPKMGSVVLEVCSTTSIRGLSLKLRREKTVRFFCFLWESGLRGNGEASDASVLEPGPQGSPSVEDRRFSEEGSARLRLRSLAEGVWAFSVGLCKWCICVCASLIFSQRRFTEYVLPPLAAPPCGRENAGFEWTAAASLRAAGR